MFDSPFDFIFYALFGLILAALLSPIEALGWYAGWFGDPASDDDDDSPPDDDVCSEGTEAEQLQTAHFVVYLAGINGIDNQRLSRFEREFFERLADEDDANFVIVQDVFPYALYNQSLTGQRVFAWFWKVLQRWRRTPASMLVNLRNFFQVAVSADSRYGPIYNHSTAELIVRRLRRAGYREGCGAPITLIGYSGGGQIGIGAAPFIREALDAPTSVISVGGVMSSAPGLRYLHHLWHLQGSLDNVHKIGLVAFPGRWRIFPNSTWNIARRRGVIEVVPIEGIEHTGKRGYFDRNALDAHGISNWDRTYDTILDLLRKRHSETPPDSNEGPLS